MNNIRMRTIFHRIFKMAAVHENNEVDNCL